jgi:hypothetical protein
MIHCIYVQSRPKELWHLATCSTSAQVVLKDKQTLLEDAIKNGNTEAKVAIKTYNSIWEAMETVKDIQESEETEKLLFN